MQNSIVRFVKYLTGIITKYAGIATTAGSTGDYGAATSAYLSRPRGVALDSLNNLYIADTENNRIRVVNAVTNIIMTVAGAVLTGGYGGDFQLGTTTSAALKNPYGIVYDPWLNCMYIADSTNNRIRVLTSNGMLYTVAGSGVSGTSGDSGPPLAARLNNPLAITVDTNGNVYIGDTNNNVIRQIVYNPNLGLSTCAPGEYSCATTPSGCCTCPTGSYCINYLKYQCPINTYNAMTGGASAAVCLACPSYMAAAAGSSACSYLVNTITGTGLAGSTGDNGPATVALLDQPAAAVMDKSGNMYISSTGSGMIQKIKSFASSKGANQIITHVAGNLNGYNAVTDGVAASSAYLASPSDIDVDLSGNVYIANTNYNNVRMISVVDGSISTVAGFASSAGGSYSGDGVQATSSYLYMPFGLFIDVSANIYIGDTYNHRIRFVNAVTGIITTVAGRTGAGSTGDGGSATSARLNYPRGICLDSSGRLYIADTANNRIRVVINGIVSTLAGKNDHCFPLSTVPLSHTPVPTLFLISLCPFLFVGSGTAGYAGDGGRPTAASLYYPWDVAVDKSGNVYFTDSQYSAVRLINTTTITSIVSGLYSSVHYTGDAGPASLANFYTPYFLTMDPAGQALYIGDSGNNVVRSISLSSQNAFPSNLCPVGQAWFSPQCAGCCACAKGSYCPGDNNQYACPAGTLNRYNNSISANACVSCGAGNYSSVAGSPMCTPCPAGTYSSSATGTGSTYCVSCPIGTYNPMMGASSSDGCLTCAAGMESLGGATACSFAITTIAGITGQSGSTGDGGNGASALLSTDANGFTADLATKRGYIADYSNNKVRVLDLTMGTISTLATSTSTSLPATMWPVAVAIGGSGKSLFVTDYGNHVVRKIVLSTGIMSRYVGTNAAGCSTGSTLGNSFWLYSPRGIVVDSSDNLYIADTSNNRIVMTSNSTYMTATVAGQTLGVAGGNSGSTGDGGPATSARLTTPWGVALDLYGTLYIADTGNCRVRRVSSGIITTVAGLTSQGVCGYAGDGGPATSAVLDQVVSLAFSPSNDMYIADINNYCIRVVKASTGIITTFTGNCVSEGGSGDGPIAYARFSRVFNIVFDVLGNLYVTDLGNYVVRKISMAATTGTSTFQAATSNMVNTFAGSGTYSSYPTATYPGMSL